MEDRIMVYDSHAHLFPDFIENPEQLLNKPEVDMVANSALSLEQYQFALNLMHRNNNKVITCLGIPPQKLHKMEMNFPTKALAAMEQHLLEIKAVGEIGLDYHWVQEPALIKKQREVFLQALAFASGNNLPVIVHSRKAEKDCLEMLKKYAETPIMMHCFAGSLDELKTALDLDYYISIPTAVCNRKKHVKISKYLPLEKMLLETDSPFLSPVRGKKNEPAFIKFAVEKVAAIKGIEMKEVSQENEKNFKRFYRVP